jgi:hypothetical protein
MMVGIPVRMVKVAEGHDGERKKREDCSKNRGAGWFFLIFGPPISPCSEHEICSYL